MSDMQDTTVIEAPPETEIPQPEPSPAEPDAPVEVQPEWAQRFPNGADDMWKSYREAEAAKTRAEQRAAELERQQQEYESQQQAYYDPFDAMPPTIDEGTQQRLAEWAQRSPAEAAQWAYQNHATVGQEVAGQLFQYWQTRDYWAAENWKAQVIHAQHYAQMRQEIQQEFEPVRQHTTQQQSQFTLDLVRQQIPDFDNTWMPRIVEFLETPGNEVWRHAIDVAGNGTEGAAERLYDIYLILHGRDQQRSRSATAAPAPPPDPSSQTETTSTGQARDDSGRFATQTNTTTPKAGRRTGRLDHL